MIEKDLILLALVIDCFVEKGTPVGSKFLYSSWELDLAPSTIRKYLNFLEKSWMVYQPHASSWRVPTVKWLNEYLKNITKEIDESEEKKEENIKKMYKHRETVRDFVEILWEHTDWVAFWFLNNDDYCFLGIWNLLKKVDWEIDEVIPLMEFIEKRKIIWVIKKKWYKKNTVNYNFTIYNWTTIATIYIVVNVWWHDSILWVIWPLRLNYKRNVTIMKSLLSFFITDKQINVRN